jgi:hypothetical protein
MYRQLFIDDLRTPPTTDWVVVRSFAEAIAYFDNHGIPDRISFDHDLGELIGHLLPTGMDVAKAIVEGVLDGRYVLPRDFSYQVHSANPVGRANIVGLMDGLLRHLG